MISSPSSQSCATAHLHALDVPRSEKVVGTYLREFIKGGEDEREGKWCGFEFVVTGLAGVRADSRQQAACPLVVINS